MIIEPRIGASTRPILSRLAWDHRARYRLDTHEEYAGPPDGLVIDPVCGMSVDPAHAAAQREYQSHGYFFCGPGCADAFDAGPARSTRAAPRT